MTDAGWAAISSIAGSLITGAIAWRSGNKAAGAKQVAEDVRTQTEQQTVVIDEIDRKADQAVAQNDGRLSKLETQLGAVTAELTAAKTQNATLQHVIERLVSVKEGPPAPPVVLTPVALPVASAEGGRRQGDPTPSRPSDPKP